MGAVTGSDTYFTNIDSGFTATKWETLIQQAINRVNGAARDNVLPSMTGTAGTKAVTLTSEQEGYVRSITALLYQCENKMPSSGGVGIATDNVPDVRGHVELLIKEAAAALTELDWSQAFI
jgi:hypothetical protein